jgi:hypothetical protein
MQVHINEVVSQVRAVDGESLLSPAAMQRIVAASVQAMQQVQARDRSRSQDTRLDNGESGDGAGQGTSSGGVGG